MNLGRTGKLRAIAYLIVSCLIAFESSMYTYGRLAERDAQRAMPVLQSLQIGKTSRYDIDKAFEAAQIALANEPCSGDGCSGESFEISNYPRFTLSERAPIDTLIAKLSLFYPTDVSVDMYFQYNRLSEILVGYQRGDAVVRIAKQNSENETGITSMWRGGNAKAPSDIEVIILEKEDSPSSQSITSLNLTCFVTMSGCRSALGLWPDAPPATLGMGSR